MHKHKRPGRRGDRITDAERLHRRNGIEADYTIGPVHEAQRRADERFGLDRLPDLVEPELARKFGRQRAKLEALLDADDLDVDAIEREAKRMLNAYEVLTRRAEELGAPEANPDIWELPWRDGVLAFCRRMSDMPAYMRDNPGATLIGAEELGRILDAQPMLIEAQAPVSRCCRRQKAL